MTSRESILALFESFRIELDEHNDKREHLIKSSRDITNLSKKVIFLLHRLVLNQLSKKQEDYRNITEQSRSKLAEIQSLLGNLQKELDEAQFWRYQKNISPGLQEYIEALSFTHYLEHGTLVTFAEVQQSLSDENGLPFFPLPLDEYFLGTSDLTGELMRFAITAISSRGGRSKAKEVCDFVRNCQADFEGFTPYIEFLSKKQAVTAQSIVKIEDAAYAIALRSTEYGDAEGVWDSVVDQFRDPRGNQEQHSEDDPRQNTL